MTRLSKSIDLTGRSIRKRKSGDGKDTKPRGIGHDRLQAAAIEEHGTFLDQAGHLCGFTDTELRTIYEYLRNGGDRVAAIATTRQTRNPRWLAGTFFGQIQVQTFIRMMLMRSGMNFEALRTVRKALKADKRVAVAGGKATFVPDWKHRLQAAELILKSAGAFAALPPVERPPEQPRGAYAGDVDWNAVHPEVRKFYILAKRWPRSEEREWLEQGKRSAEEILENRNRVDDAGDAPQPAS